MNHDIPSPMDEYDEEEVGTLQKSSNIWCSTSSSGWLNGTSHHRQGDLPPLKDRNSVYLTSICQWWVWVNFFSPKLLVWSDQLTSLLSFALTGESGQADSPAPGPQFRGHGVQHAPLQRELRGLPECHGQWPAGHFAGGTLRIEPERVCGLNGWILWQFPWIKNMLKV